MPNNIKKRDIEVEEMDLKPFMNLMVVLIPLLLASAQFAKIATVDISLPKGGSQTHATDTTKDKDEDENMMMLTCAVTDTNFTLLSKAGPLLTIYFDEYHDYVKADDNTKRASDVQYKPRLMYDTSGNYLWDKVYPDSLMNVNGIQFNKHEREEIKLWALAIDTNFERTNNPWKGVYRKRTIYTNKDGEYTENPDEYAASEEIIEYITRGLGDRNKPFFPLSMEDIKVDEKFYAFTTRMSPYQRREEILYKVDERTGNKIKDPDDSTKYLARDTTFARLPFKVTQAMIDNKEFYLAEASAYDILKDVFLEVRYLNPEAKDVNSLIIASEHQVFYDKVVQIMDVAKNSGLTELSLNGFRSNE